ncbi:iron-containing redox enzyme family protein [Rhizobium ruizarguesonis]|uniref:LodA/GoxA family CTQ-dependent oxidase n=1 Tax=Rhizobium ruizarguesonis TaxID=2081791 RepID=UPI00163B271E|nr:LodA/GoxA family CTQ-dependent oxidase [Rhizobium ruizarguesonis]MBC2807007.1 iron-containing redox enzyme family protein [Rhizobium ruizarguesonis]
MSIEELCYVKIFPAIGIARVGDSTDAFFYGPEFEPKHEVPVSYRDQAGRLKRQAARFRIFAFKADGSELGEITSSDATIEWSVELANKKAAWFEFHGARNARAAFRGAAPDGLPCRNASDDFGAIERIDGRYVSDARREKLLEIKGGEITISGKGVSAAIALDPERYKFRDHFMQGLNEGDGKEVYLGELATDEEGRLIVLGGHGIAEPVDEMATASDYERQRAKVKHWITNYANNDYWHDDTSDGPVRARITLPDGKAIDATNGAWVIVAPPDFAPEIENLVTLYDVMEEVGMSATMSRSPDTPSLGSPTAYDFESQIRPILDRVNGYRWVSPVGLRGHGHGKPGEMDEERISDANKEGRPGTKERQRIFSLIRRPTYEGVDPVTGNVTKAQTKTDWALQQANYTFMPPLSGDQGDCEVGMPEHWLTVTHLQYVRLEQWADDAEKSVEDGEYRNPSLPHKLTRNALTACAGGAFFPGIEMTAIAREPSLYCEPFRIDHQVVSAGDITKYMACPWQADFYECRDDWWPAQRPDNVITEDQFRQVLENFQIDGRDGIEKALFSRERWDRGLDRRPWPDRAYIQSLLRPQEKEASADYVARIAAMATDAFADIEIGTARKDRVVSPWRCQFLLQSRLDQLAGRYFLPVVPDVREAFEDDGAIFVEIAEKYREPALSLDRLRSRWLIVRDANPEFAIAITSAYLDLVKKRLEAYLEEVIRGPWEKDKIKVGFMSATPDPQEFPDEFAEKSDAHLTLRAGEMRGRLFNYLFLQACGQQGDMAMVDGWRHLGVVRSRTVSSEDGEEAETVYVETEREGSSSMSYREHFYRLMNDEKFPEHDSVARTIAEETLADAQRLIDFKLNYDSSHPESFVPYTPETFREKLDEIYEILREGADEEQQYVYKYTRDRVVASLVGNAPFNQVDGAWLRSAADAGPMTGVTSLLFEIWSDEVGNGDPALHHGNLYTTLLRQLGVLLPAVNSRDYAEHEALDEQTFIGPVFELAISKFTKDYLPEILGMTLYLEWEVLSLVPIIRVYDYFGIDSQFYRMHVGIDNASDGHGAKARDAVIAYLDRVLEDGGESAQQEQWSRIWRGFVAFATVNYDQFQSFEPTGDAPLSLERIRSQMPRTPADEVAELIERKLPRGELNHMRKQLSVFRINDLFSDPKVFMDELANSPWVTPGQPDSSRLITHLTTFKGPMYKVFAGPELDVWKRWIEWLGEEGDTSKPKHFLSRAEAMLLLVSDMKSQMTASSGHKLYRAHVGTGKKREQMPLAEIFSNRSSLEIMEFLADPSNGYLVPYEPAKSALIVDLLRPGREMGRHLDRQFPALHNQIGRMVVYEWVAAGCQIPGKGPSKTEAATVTRRRPRRLLMQQYGMGAVH